ncbi:MAG: DUF1456 family protein [Granulosicoccaceae bacterium]
MDNNELLRRLRYSLQIDDQVAVRVIKQGGLKTTLEEVGTWRLKDEEPGFAGCPNQAISAFLAGYIVEKRGSQEGKPVPQPSKAHIENNTVLKLMKIALSMRGDDLQACMETGGASLSVSEVNALLRKPDSRNYRQCGDQVLRQFLNGVGQRERDSE